MLEPADDEDTPQEKYTTKVATPIYEPQGLPVELGACMDIEKYAALTKKIDASSLSDQEKEFLRLAATRHIVFDYQSIAEYYAGKATKEMQEHMEDSALVIIDIDSAIARGYVLLSKTVKGLMDDAT